MENPNRLKIILLEKRKDYKWLFEHLNINPMSVFVGVQAPQNKI